MVLVVVEAGAVSPLMVGRGVVVPDACGTATRSERQTPRPDTMELEFEHFASTQVPPLSF